MKYICLCEACGRQYSNDGSLAHFHCLCGETITVTKPKSHTSTLIRCSGCGASREAKEEICSFCKSHFTLHEKDLDTVCPKCFTRNTRKANFCHSCGHSLKSAVIVKKVSKRSCPVCDNSFLNHRKLGEKKLNILECDLCAGFWIDHSSFHEIEDSALEDGKKKSAPFGGVLKNKMQPQKGPYYRKCPECSDFMSRRNYGRESAVIIDICSDHGIWLDDKELGKIVSWIKERAIKDTSLPKGQKSTKLKQTKKKSISVYDAPQDFHDDELDLTRIIFNFFSS